jgi:hypothetical protein
VTTVAKSKDNAFPELDMAAPAPSAPGAQAAQNAEPSAIVAPPPEEGPKPNFRVKVDDGPTRDVYAVDAANAEHEFKRVTGIISTERKITVSTI